MLKWTSLNLLLVLVVVVVVNFFLVKSAHRDKFRSCSGTSFCKRQREPKQWTYEIDPTTIVVKKLSSSSSSSSSSSNNNNIGNNNNNNNNNKELILYWEAILQYQNEQYRNLYGSLKFRINRVINDIIRIYGVDLNLWKPKYHVPHIISDPSSSSSISNGKLELPMLCYIDKKYTECTWANNNNNNTTTSDNNNNNNNDIYHYTIKIFYSPFEIQIIKKNEIIIKMNELKWLYMETSRNRTQEDPEEWWQESHSSHTYPHERGPEAVGCDFTLLHAQTLYGIPEHALSLALRNTYNYNGGNGVSFGEPYRLYNLDVFEYELDIPDALYGAIPFIVSHIPSIRHSTGIFWLNPSETYIDIMDSVNGPGKNVHWMSESGVFESYILLANTPKELLHKYALLTAFPQFPPAFSIGHHQCRWNYNSQDDVRHINDLLIEWNTPTDVIWLDIEHTDGKKYFTWDNYHFSQPEEMISYVSSFGRKMVTIVDPHIKSDPNYYIYSGIDSQDLWVKTKDGENYNGWCWPGDSKYPDFTNPKMREFWAQQFDTSKYQHSTQDLFIWNDMNEPSVFNGPEVTMPKSCKHLGGWEHGELHNLYGYFVHWATFDGLLLRSKGKMRPFILSRSFFAGSQKFGAIWTGDNTADWKHLKISVPMLLSLSIAGLPFVGADVGGFFTNPTPELMTRWYELGAYYPFFRNHAHQDTKRRELWEFEETYAHRMRNAIVQRYQLFPYVYTLFRMSSLTGEPIMRPLWFDFDQDTSASILFEEESFMFGPALLVRGIYEPGTNEVTMTLPGNSNHVWYIWKEKEGNQQHLIAGGEHIRLTGFEEGIPVFQLGGTIIPLAQRVRRSAALMKKDPITLVVALDKDGRSKGAIYIDDGATYDYQQDIFSYIRLQFFNCTLSNKIINNKYTIPPNGNLIEKVIILGPLQNIEPIAFLSNSISQVVPSELLKHTQNSLIIKTMPLHLSLDRSFQLVLGPKKCWKEK